MMDWIGFAALIVSVAVWLFNPRPVRQLLGLETKPPKVVGSMEKTRLREDPEIAEHLPDDLDLVDWQRESRRETAAAVGWTLFRLPGGRCVATDTRDHLGHYRVVLMWRPTAGPKT